MHTLTIDFATLAILPPEGYRITYWPTSDPDNITTVTGITSSPYVVYGLPETSYAGTVEASCVEGGYSAAVPWEIEISTYTMCAECGVTFNYYYATSIGKLNVGPVHSYSCYIGNYVVDWYLNFVEGDPVFTSGVGSDPDITEFHPFYGLNGRPVPAGLWIPVIRWVEINGETYSSAPMEGALLSPDLQYCLPSITVENFTCSNGFYGDYAHNISYQNAYQVPTDASRSLIFEISSDTLYVPWYFEGFSVADRLTIYYVSGATETLITDWVIGGGGYYNFDTMPYSFPEWGTLKAVIDLSGYTYQTGDYIRFVVTPSYYDPTITNTNWTLGFTCKSTPFDCTTCASDHRGLDLDTVNFTFDSANCRWILTVDTLWDCPESSDFYKYYTVGSAWGPYSSYGSGTLGYTANGIYVILNKNISCNSLFTWVNISCTPMAGSVTVTKVGDVVTYDFTTESDYLVYKNHYNSALTYPFGMASYSTDPTSYHYYQNIYINNYIGASCGDSIYGRTFVFHRSSPVVFDDVAYTMTITSLPITNSYVAPCGSCGNAVQNMVNAANGSRTAADSFFTFTSTLMYAAPVMGQYVLQFGTNDISRDFYYFEQLTAGITDVTCDLASNPDYCFSNGSYVRYYGSYNLVITDDSDPGNNWRIEKQLMDANGCPTGIWSIIYAIVGGVRTV